ncbi:MAG: FxLYD domain-containing protein [Thermodesulfobacteriota bacterium]
MDIDLIRKGAKLVQAIRKIAAAAFTIAFCSLFFFRLTSAGFSRALYDKGIYQFKHYESTPERYVQDPEGKYWQELKNRNFPLALIDWQLVTNLGSGDKYMDKRIIGTVKNNSKEEFSEVKIEFTVYDEEGSQIAVVFSNVSRFKPGTIWKFQIPVTSDVGKAELKGLYVPSRT